MTGTRQHSWLRRAVLLLVIFTSLVIWHRKSLRSPPTPDQIVGIWLEGSYLAETDFDYRKLFWEEPPASLGGPRTYMFSVLPTVVAILIKLTSSPGQALLAYHVFAIASASIALLVLFELVEPLTGTIGGFLALSAAATTPLFSVQVSLAGMEMPLAACTMLAVSYASKEQFGRSTAAATAAFFIKSNALVLVVANLCCLLFRWSSDSLAPDAFAARPRYWLIAAVNVALIAVLALIHLLGVLT